MFHPLCNVMIHKGYYRKVICEITSAHSLAINMINLDKALALSQRNLAENPLPHEDYEWIMSDPFEVDTGWCFDYSFRCRRDLPEEEKEQFAGSPGFLVAKESGVVMILNWEEYSKLKEGHANKPIQSTPNGAPDG